jgi:hypothetical protein
MHAEKVVLVSTSIYTPDLGKAVLRQFGNDRITLFCVVGVDAAAWEDAMDWLCISPDGEDIHFMTTTSHPDESVEEVISFAESWPCGSAHEVEIVYA